MNYDLIELAKRCPDLAITVRLADLVEANRGILRYFNFLNFSVNGPTENDCYYIQGSR